MPRVLFIGRSTIDLISLVEEFPHADSKVRALSNDIQAGGSALNAAITLAHLGGDAHLATSLGSDELYSNLVRSELDRHGVKPVDVCASPSFRIPVSTVISTRSTASRLIINSSADDCAETRQLPALIRSADFDIIQIDQYERHFVSAHTDALAAFTGPIVLDGGSWKDWSIDFLRLADIPIVSAEFHAQGPDGFGSLCAELSITRWAMTRGSDSVIYFDQGQFGEIPTSQVDAVDTLGAGDIFHGAFCHHFAENGQFADALARAADIAAASCTRLGTRAWMHA